MLTRDISRSDGQRFINVIAFTVNGVIDEPGSIGRRTVFAMTVRAVRGATQVDNDDREEILEATAELVAEVLDRNGVQPNDVISILFTATPDLTAEFPAYAARKMGLTDVPLMCATEIAVPRAMPRVLRLMAHVETERARADVRHVFLRGAQALRTDLPR